MISCLQARCSFSFYVGAWLDKALIRVSTILKQGCWRTSYSMTIFTTSSMRSAGIIICRCGLVRIAHTGMNDAKVTNNFALVAREDMGTSRCAPCSARFIALYVQVTQNSTSLCTPEPGPAGRYMCPHNGESLGATRALLNCTLFTVRRQGLARLRTRSRRIEMIAI